jgi:uncharacterized membrane protein (UPF0127 family)
MAVAKNPHIGGGTMLQALNRTRGTTLCGALEDAGGIGGKTRGLLGRDQLNPDQGLLFTRGRLEPFMWMHMFFMRFAIDIVFLDRENRVIHISSRLKPWRVSRIVLGAQQALELAAGAAERSRTAIGDRIEISAAPTAAATLSA